MFDVVGPPELSVFCYLIVVSSFSIKSHSVLNIVEQGVGHRDDEEGEKCRGKHSSKGGSSHSGPHFTSSTIT